MPRHATLGEGGGKFNGVDGVITDYEFTGTHPFAKEGRRQDPQKEALLFGVLTAHMDGAKDEDVDVMMVGNLKDFTISDGGRTITPVSGGNIWAKSQWGKFIGSLEALGVAAESDETDGSQFVEGVYNYQPILNRRVRFGQEIQLDKTGKVKTRKGKGRDGKERDYNDTTTVVVADYGYVNVPASANKPKTTAQAAKTGKPNGKVTEVDLTETADLALAGLLEKFGGSAPKAKLVSAPAQLFLKKNYPDTSDELRKMLYDDDFLNGAVERGAVSEYKQGSKEQTITA